MPKPHQIAVCISDLHLSLVAPVCRADEDWMRVQAYYLQQVKDIAGPLPIICAGDIFDRWNTPPELLTFALEHLPDGMLCVPGQHDLPLHRIDLMHRSGYGVLKAVKKIRDMAGTSSGNMGGFSVHGFGWEQKIKPVEPVNNFLRVALVHQYCWTIGNSYPGAPESSHLNKFMKPLKGYDVAVFGDNHKGFLQELKTFTMVLNCGSLIRRKSDEIDYEPAVGIIYSDGTVRRRKLDTSIDKFHTDTVKRKEVPFNMKEFIEGLEGLGEHGLDFREAVENHLKTEDLDPKTREIITAALG